MNRQDYGTRLAVRLAALGVALELCVSANLLTWAGVPYVCEGGSLLAKLHPGTDTIGLAFLALLAAPGAWSRLAADRMLLCALAGMAACMTAMLALTGTGNLIVLLDTFLPAILLAIVLSHATSAQLHGLRRLMQRLLVVSAVLALVEAASHTTLVPLYLNDASYYPHYEDFRPTALFDHPLTGAILTMMGLALCPASGIARLAFGSLMWAALAAYGGRMALGVSVSTLALSRLAGLGRLVLSRDPRAARDLLALVAGAVAIAVLGGTAMAFGLVPRLAGHLYWDSSAQVRLAQWQLLDRLDGWQIMFGTRREDLLSLLTPLRLGAGVEVIENFWLLMFVGLGLAGFPLFLIGLGALLGWGWRRSAGQGRLLLLGVMVVASTSNSLGRKSTVLVSLVAAIACLPARRAAPERLTPAGALHPWVSLQGLPA